jgi:hypothetical protein
VDNAVDNADISSAVSGQSLLSSAEVNPNGTEELENTDINSQLPNVSETFNQNLDKSSFDPLIKSNVTEKDSEMTSDWIENKNSIDQPMNEQRDDDKCESLETEGSVQQSALSAVNSIGVIDEDLQMSETVEGQATEFGESTMVPVKWPKV